WFQTAGGAGMGDEVQAASSATGSHERRKARWPGVRREVRWSRGPGRWKNMCAVDAACKAASQYDGGRIAKDPSITQMASTTEDLAHISTRTLHHYNTHAEQFRTGTWDHDVSQNIAALLRFITG